MPVKILGPVEVAVKGVKMAVKHVTGAATVLALQGSKAGLNL
jgi:hypothetical protein